MWEGGHMGGTLSHSAVRETDGAQAHADWTSKPRREADSQAHNFRRG